VSHRSPATAYVATDARNSAFEPGADSSRADTGRWRDPQRRPRNAQIAHNTTRKFSYRISRSDSQAAKTIAEPYLDLRCRVLAASPKLRTPRAPQDEQSSISLNCRNYEK